MFETGTKKFFLFLILFVIVLTNALPASATGFITVKKSSGSRAPKEPEVVINSEAVTIAIQNQMVKTRVVQVFRNTTGRILEGDYMFPLPFGANIVSFATWDDGMRINGVIMEKVKAKKIYDDIVSKMKDPGLLENAGSNTFRARIFPIPAFGTKRLELEYVEYLPLANGLYSFTYPLHSSDFKMPPRDLSIDVEIASGYGIIMPQIYFKNIAFTKNQAGTYGASYKALGFSDAIDFKLSYSLDISNSRSKVLVFKDKTEETEETYFLTNFRPFEHETRDGSAAVALKKAVFLVDVSYSMKGGKMKVVRDLFSKLETFEGFGAIRAYFFNSGVRDVSSGEAPCSGDSFGAIRNKLSRIRPFSYSDPLSAIRELVDVIKKDGRNDYKAILISDGNFEPSSQDGAPLEKTLKTILASEPAVRSNLTLSAIGVGNDCNNDRMSMISNAFSGEFRPVAASDAGQASICIAQMMKSALSGIVKDLRFSLKDPRAADIYPNSGVNVNFESERCCVGKLFQKGPFELNAAYNYSGAPKSAKLASDGSDSPGDWYIPLLWGRERVNYLTAYIEQNGENEAMKKEIIKLSKRFNFVTKYTSFIAVPPSILRPRRIKPGDPEVYVNAPADSRLVMVNLPFGEAVKAEYNRKKEAFVARFTAPAHVRDGEYNAVILIVDRWGRETHENASFWIDSTPPELYVSCSPGLARPGSLMTIKANASSDTASITARDPSGKLINLKYDALTSLSKAVFEIGTGHPPGGGKFEIEAIDHAGNRTVKYLKYAVSNEKQAGDDNEKL